MNFLSQVLAQLFMHIAPPEPSQTASTVTPSQRQTQTSQHGLHSAHHHISDSRHDDRLVGEQQPALDLADDASVASSTTGRGRRAYAGRMSLERQDSNDSSPGGRIDAYERANAIPRRPSDGMVFQVVPSTNTSSDVTVLDLPNGRCGGLSTST